MTDYTSSFPERGFLKAIVTQTSSPFLTREFAYCLHCRKLRSIPWFYHHNRRTMFEPSAETQRVFQSKFEAFVRDIFTEVELLHESGKLFLRPRDSHRQADAVPRSLQQPPSQCAEQQRPFNEQTTFPEQNDPFDNEDEEGDDNESPQFVRLAQCISDCFLEFCFGDRTFDTKLFASLSETFFGNENEMGCKAFDMRKSIKARVVSRIMRKVFVMLSVKKSDRCLKSIHQGCTHFRRQ